MLLSNECVPCCVDEWLVEEAVDDARVHPVILAEARLKVARNVLDVAFAGWVKSGAEAASPVLALSQKLDHFFGVRAGFASVALLVMLVERVRAPEATVAAGFRAGVFSPALVKFVFVAFPVVLAFKASLTRGAPIDVLLVAARGRHLGTVDNGGAAGRSKRRSHGSVAGT